MKGPKELLILAIPLLAAGCNGGGSSTSPPPPPAGVDAEGIFEGTAGGGDSLFGIVAYDGTALFLEYPDTATVPPAASQGAIIVPTAVLPDQDGAFSVPFSVDSNNGFTFPSGYVLAPSFSGSANTNLGSLSVTYLTKNGAPAIFTMSYDATSYEVGASVASFVGTYTADYYVGTTHDSAQIIIDDQGGIDVTETAFGCHYTGQWAIPNTAGNAYEVAFGSQSAADCADASGQISLQGLASLFNSGSTMFAIMYDKGLGQGIFITATKIS